MSVMIEKSKPWYREPWPWILMIMPVMAVVAGSFMMWLATSTEDGLVEDDYYKKGLTINQTIERDQNAQSLHIKAQLMVGDDPTHLRLMLMGGELKELPRQLRLKVLHPTRSGLDQEVLLTRRGEGYYEGARKVLGAAKWRLILEDMDKRWRLTGVWHVPKDSSVALSSQG